LGDGLGRGGSAIGTRSRSFGGPNRLASQVLTSRTNRIRIDLGFQTPPSPRAHKGRHIAISSRYVLQQPVRRFGTIGGAKATHSYRRQDRRISANPKPPVFRWVSGFSWPNSYPLKPEDNTFREKFGYPRPAAAGVGRVGSERPARAVMASRDSFSLCYSQVCGRA
jgi:hypothetical protein